MYLVFQHALELRREIIQMNYRDIIDRGYNGRRSKMRYNTAFSNFVSYVSFQVDIFLPYYAGKTKK